MEFHYLKYLKKIWLDVKDKYLSKVAMSLANKEYMDKMLTKNLIVQWENIYSNISNNTISGLWIKITTYYPRKIFAIYFPTICSFEVKIDFKPFSWSFLAIIKLSFSPFDKIFLLFLESSKLS